MVKENTDYQRHKGVKIEELVTGQTYAISINPKFQPTALNKHRIYFWYRAFYDSLVKHKNSVELKLYLESSPTARLHFHGTIRIKEIIGYLGFLSALAEDTSYEIDTIEDEQVWIEYTQKQYDIWEPYFEGNIIGYPIKITKDSQYIQGPVEVIKLNDQQKGHIFDQWMA